MEEAQPLVLDMGCHSLRLGYAGSDSPQRLYPLAVGIVNGQYLPSSPIVFPLNPTEKRDHVDVAFPIQYSVESPELPGTLHYDFQVLEQMLLYIMGPHGLDDAFNEHPALLTESNITDYKFRDSMLELMFEGFQVPLLFFGKKATLASYAVAKTSGMVLDMGASCINLAVVQEGYINPSFVSEYPIGGSLLDKYILNALETPSASGVRQSKVTPSFALSQPHEPTRVSCAYVNPSYMNWCRQNVATLVKEGMQQQPIIPSTAGMTGASSSSLQSPMALPDGTRIQEEAALSIQALLPELFFNPTHVLQSPHLQNLPLESLYDNRALSNAPFDTHTSASEPPTLTYKTRRNPNKLQYLGNGETIRPSLGELGQQQTVVHTTPTLALDVKQYISAFPGIPQMLHNTLLQHEHPMPNCLIATGGSTLFKGFLERLQQELATHPKHAPTNPNLQVVASPRAKERQFASWIGGSIISSLGSFPQFCITVDEYNELGGQTAADKKCP